MKQEPYLIYIDKRPIRITFLINSEKDTILQIQKVIEYNMYKWGGRYNPIIFTDGKVIKGNWWKFLVNIDPDIIISLLPLENDLIQKIDLSLSPISLKIEDPSKDYIHSEYEGLSISPNINNINKLLSSTLILFDIDEKANSFLNKFIKINFCSYPNNLIDTIELNDNNKKVFKIIDEKDLISAFRDLSAYNNFTFPIQICSIPHKFREVEFSGFGIPFTVIVGDSPEDIVYNWNMILSYPNWQKNNLNNIWLPADLANNNEFVEVLKKWLKKICQDSGRINHRIKFISFSLSKKELKIISDRLTKNTLSNITETFNEIQIPDFQQNQNYIAKINMDSYYLTGNQNQINLNPPIVEKNIISRELWVADIYMHFHPERYPNIQNRTLYWKLPKHSSLAFNLFGFKSRICSNRFPSVFLNRENPKLIINLLTDPEIFRILLTKENRAILNSVPRNSIEQDLFTIVEPSNTGKYMSGFINLFKDIYKTKQFLEKKYWRHMFDILSNANPKKDNEKKEEIYNALKKKDENFLNSKKGLIWLTDYVLKLSKDIVYLNKEIDFSNFKEEAEQECELFNFEDKNKKFGYLADYFIKMMNTTLKELIELGIIQIGIRPQCPNCGIRQWFHIDEIKQNLICKGCRFLFSIKPEEKWFYKLNSLIQLGYSQQGLTPVILVLGQLLEESLTSFIYDTSLNVFKKNKNKPFTDLDIVCIQDGKFIIGEVKQSIQRFKDDDFTKMKEVAVRIKPDKIIFSSLDNKCSNSLRKKINKLEKDLQSLKIEVKWYSLKDKIFESTPSL
ncbi:MAG: hypothetical protein K8S23_00400 [Candidatus Cloacimonetes bacterium]|nr:hypothetical protein [Candidatus Cloacimonadota bacterium]